MPVTRLPTASTAIDGATAISACASVITTILTSTSVRLSMRSPSGTNSTMPSSRPPKDSVGIQPVVAASALKLRGDRRQHRRLIVNAAGDDEGGDDQKHDEAAMLARGRGQIRQWVFQWRLQDAPRV